MKKLKVNTEGCIGCGACVGLDPEHFTFNEDNLSVVKSEENIEEEKITNIVEICPVGVISYEESEEETCNCEHSDEFDRENTSCECPTKCHHCCCDDSEEEKAA